MTKTFVSYSQWIPQIVPGFLQNTNGQLLFSSLGKIKDFWVTASLDALKVQYATKATTDALPFIGQTRNIESYYLDTTASYISRLTSSFSIWEAATTKQGLQQRLTDFGFSFSNTPTSTSTGQTFIVPWRTAVSSGFIQANIGFGTMPEPYQNHWSAFWIIVSGSNLYFTPNFKTVSGSSTTLHGNYWGKPGLIWGDGQCYGVSSSIPNFVGGYFQQLHKLIRKYKNGIEINPSIIWTGNGNVWGSGSYSGSMGTRVWGGNTTYFNMVSTPCIILG